MYTDDAAVSRERFCFGYEQENPMTKSNNENREPKNETQELTIDELNVVSGGGQESNQTRPISNMQKKFSDTANGIVANMK
jgi:hypothetical protein